MALQKNTETNFGIKVNGAYYRIEGFNLMNKEEASINVSAYADKTKRAFANKCYVFPYDLNGENPLKQGYAFLKTLDEFKDAIDV